jgi:dTDP-glucose 4,6-dehydratase
VVNVDALTYAGHQESVAPVRGAERHIFEEVDIANRTEVERVFDTYRPDAVLHLAAESHVDRSIDGSDAFLQTNVIGTHVLLEVSRRHIEKEAANPGGFRFVHVSTDEVYGELGDEGYFTEDTEYDPRSPYSATKASADHLVRAWHHTYGLPVLITNCSNNYGPYQYPEKLIPVIILKALQHEPIPVYGTGENVRDWLYVDDHVQALLQVLKEGQIGSTYVVGGDNEKQNIEVVETVCDVLNRIHPSKKVGSYRDLVTFVEDRPGHDYRYAIDASKIEEELRWTPSVGFDSGIERTVQWYLKNIDWCETVTENSYSLERLGLNA